MRLLFNVSTHVLRADNHYRRAGCVLGIVLGDTVDRWRSGLWLRLLLLVLLGLLLGLLRLGAAVAAAIVPVAAASE